MTFAIIGGAMRNPLIAEPPRSEDAEPPHAITEDDVWSAVQRVFEGRRRPIKQPSDEALSQVCQGLNDLKLLGAHGLDFRRNNPGIVEAATKLLEWLGDPPVGWGPYRKEVGLLPADHSQIWPEGILRASLKHFVELGSKDEKHKGAAQAEYAAWILAKQLLAGIEPQRGKATRRTAPAVKLAAEFCQLMGFNSTAKTVSDTLLLPELREPEPKES